MKQLSIFPFLLAAVLLLGACNNNDKSGTDTTLPSQPVNADAVNTPVKTDTPNNNMPVAPAAMQQQPANSGIVLNPPHGQPGHSCDIEVGQPLNSAPTNKPAGQPVMTTPSQAPVANPALPNAITPNSGQVRINPAHGQPGHRCDVAVGAAL
ncbi:hypothetical protein ACFS6H_12845 [Terrimonas rubra]|uniref:Uncharacterized protein n=1 Tax=Terrimonas rubra TaxID=1035890 RepID=A0ABW6A764_9BACT